MPKVESSHAWYLSKVFLLTGTPPPPENEKKWKKPAEFHTHPEFEESLKFTTMPMFQGTADHLGPKAVFPPLLLHEALDSLLERPFNFGSFGHCSNKRTPFSI